MAPRPAWKGYLKLSLVTCAVELSNVVTHAEKVTFHILNRETGNRVKRIYVDAETGDPVEPEDEIKGYQVEDGEYIQIEEDEIAALQIESSNMLDLDGFVDKASIQPIYLDTPYYLAPADKVSEDAFAVIREAMAAKKKAGLARIVLFQRERPAIIEPFGRGMLLTTLRYDRTVRQPDTVLDDIPNLKTDKEMIELARNVIEKNASKFDPSEFDDKYEETVIELIRAKRAGKKISRPRQTEEKPSNVVNLFDALKKSLAADNDEGPSGRSSSKKTPSKGKPTSRRKSS
ncbi:MAG: Ku protein [Proteobacteria bacterium]|nr:MAG: Ku protein [Pseudomonadota bacterium]